MHLVGNKLALCLLFLDFSAHRTRNTTRLFLEVFLKIFLLLFLWRFIRMILRMFLRIFLGRFLGYSKYIFRMFLIKTDYVYSKTKLSRIGNARGDKCASSLLKTEIRCHGCCIPQSSCLETSLSSIH